MVIIYISCNAYYKWAVNIKICAQYMFWLSEIHDIGPWNFAEQNRTSSVLENDVFKLEIRKFVYRNVVGRWLKTLLKCFGICIRNVWSKLWLCGIDTKSITRITTTTATKLVRSIDFDLFIIISCGTVCAQCAIHNTHIVRGVFVDRRL